VSQIQPVAADLTHQRSPFRVGRRRIGLRVEESTCFFKEFDTKVGETVEFLPTVFQRLQKNGYIIIRVVMRFTACTRAEQHDAIDLTAVN
jgi:hypothetical protein